MDDRLIPFALSFLVITIVFIVMHDRHYQSRGTRILENRVRMLEEIVSEWTN